MFFKKKKEKKVEIDKVRRLKIRLLEKEDRIQELEEKLGKCEKLGVKSAYYVVFEDMIKHAPDLFFGVYDSEDFDEEFMYGVSCVMEYLAVNCNREALERYQEIFMDNFIVSDVLSGKKKS